MIIVFRVMLYVIGRMTTQVLLPWSEKLQATILEVPQQSAPCKSVEPLLLVVVDDDVVVVVDDDDGGRLKIKEEKLHQPVGLFKFTLVTKHSLLAQAC